MQLEEKMKTLKSHCIIICFIYQNGIHLHYDFLGILLIEINHRLYRKTLNMCKFKKTYFLRNIRKPSEIYNIYLLLMRRPFF